MDLLSDTSIQTRTGSSYPLPSCFKRLTLFSIADMFAIQSVSRFALMYLLTKHNALAPNAVVMSICNPGLSLDELSIDNLSLQGKPYSEKWKATLAIDQSKRDSTVIDSINEVPNSFLSNRLRLLTVYRNSLLVTQNIDSSTFILVCLSPLFKSRH